MFINLNVIITCFCVGGIPAVRLESDVVETELLWKPSGDGSALLTSAFLSTLLSCICQVHHQSGDRPNPFFG